MSNTFLTSLREKRESKTSLIQATLDRAAEEARDLSEVELANVEALNLEIKNALNREPFELTLFHSCPHIVIVYQVGNKPRSVSNLVKSLWWHHASLPVNDV